MPMSLKIMLWKECHSADSEILLCLHACGGRKNEYTLFFVHASSAILIPTGYELCYQSCEQEMGIKIIPDLLVKFAAS